jgi:hypothetical protein
VLGDNTFEVQVSDSKTKVFNVRDLALYKGEEMPIYRERPSSVDGKSSDTPLSNDLDNVPLEEKSEDLDIPEYPRPGEENPEKKSAVVQKSSLKVGSSRKRSRDQDTTEIDLQPPSKRHRSSEEPTSDHQGDVNPLREDQWVLAYDKNLNREGKVSLMVGRVTDVDVAGLGSLHVYRPRSIRKKVRYLPMFYRFVGLGDEEYETKITDQKLEKDWLPWMIDLGHTVRIVAKSLPEEEGRAPPKRFEKFYRLVWDGKIKETDSLEESVATQNAAPKLRSGPSVVAKEHPSKRRSKRRGNEYSLQKK